MQPKKAARRVSASEARQAREAEQARLERNARRRELYAERRAEEIRLARIEERARLARNERRRELYAAQREAERLAAEAAERRRKVAKKLREAEKAGKAKVPAKVPAKPVKVPAKPAKPAKPATPPVKAPPVKTPPVKTPPAVKAPPVKTPPVKAPPVKAPPVKAPIAPVDVKELVTPFDHWHTELIRLRKKYRKKIQDKFTIKGKDRKFRFLEIIEEMHENGKYSYHVVIEVRAPIMDSTIQPIMDMLKGPIDNLFKHAAITGDLSVFSSLRMSEYSTDVVGSPDPGSFMADGDDDDAVFMQTWQGTTAKASRDELYYAIWNRLNQMVEDAMSKGAMFLEYAVIRLYDEEG